MANSQPKAQDVITSIVSIFSNRGPWILCVTVRHICLSHHDNLQIPTVTYSYRLPQSWK